MSHEYALLYINSSSIILGRHQNAFEEINYPYILKKNYPVYRRISGGGTVYHDPGNLNFSFITRYDQKKFNNYAYFNRPLVEVLNTLKVPAELNARNDIVLEGKKISGNAQFTSLDRMVSHGTLLFSTNLGLLSETLKLPPYKISSRAIKSVRSEVTNISEYLDMKNDLLWFKDIISRHLFGNEVETQMYTFGEKDWLQIRQLAEKKYRQWDWNFGESPPSTLEIQKETGEGIVQIELGLKKGKIEHFQLQGNNFLQTQIQELQKRINGTRFRPQEVKACLKNLPVDLNAKRIFNLLFNP
jgi:lipoate-protein ligase A